jgi:STE24 endopeptidase
MKSRIILVLAVLLALAFSAAKTAAKVISPPTPPPAAVLHADDPKSFDPAAATQAWLDTVPAEKRKQSDAYFEGGYWLILWDFLLTAAISILLLQSGISARLRDLAERVTRFQWLHTLLYFIPFILLFAALSFPLSLYRDFFREHQYGLATQTFWPWFAEQLIGLGLAVVGFSIALTILYAVFRRAGRTWWLWAAIVVVIIIAFASFISPLYIEPLFNSYKPLEDPSVRDPIIRLAEANQIPVKQVFVVDASRQTTKISANVAGFLGTTRIALNDNLLKDCSLPEIRQVMAHEMGHYVLNHGAKLVAFSGIQFLFVFALIEFLFSAATRRWGERWRVRGLSDPAGLPLLILILNGIFFLLTPVTNTVGRVTEREADAFGLNTSREPDGMAAVSLKLGSYRKLNPGPLEEFIFFDHPSGRARIRMAMDWKAAQTPCGSSQGKAAPSVAKVRY